MKSIKIIGFFFVVAQFLLMSREVSCLSDKALERNGRRRNAGPHNRNARIRSNKTQNKTSSGFVKNSRKAGRVPNRVLFRENHPQLYKKRNVRSGSQVYGVSDSPIERLEQMKLNSKSIISGVVYLDKILTIYPLKDVPKNVKILTLSVRPKTIDCSIFPCGDINALFAMNGNISKQEYKQQVAELRKANPDIIILLELHEKILHSSGTIDGAIDNIDQVLDFMDEFNLEGINFQFNPEYLKKRMSSKKNVMDDYVKFLNEIISKLDEDKLVALTLNLSGALSNISNAANTENYQDPDSQFSVINLKSGSISESLKRAASLPTAGMAIPLLKELREDINLVVVYGDSDYPDHAQNNILVDIYRSYLHYADIYGFTVHMGFGVADHDNSPIPFCTNDFQIIDQICEDIKEENEEYTSGDGVSILELGYLGAMINDSAVMKIFESRLA